jgi:(S)-ureidoglycine aminohydrolase
MPARFHWLRKRYEPAPGIARARGLRHLERDVAPVAGCPTPKNRWGTTRFVDPDDLRHDACQHRDLPARRLIPFEETHVMEHGLYVLEGKAVYKLNQDWVEVEAGDFMWLRAYCPQACYAAGPGPFRYLLYKDVNRHAKPARPLVPSVPCPVPLHLFANIPRGSGGVKPPGSPSKGTSHAHLRPDAR